MKSILEYNGNQVEIEVPEWVVEHTKWLDENVEADLPDGKYEYEYNILQGWYEQQAAGIFDDADLFMEGFNNHTEEMKKQGIVDYCRFIVFNCF